MSEPIPRTAAESTTSGKMVVELYAGPFCGLPMLVPPGTETIEVTYDETGEVFIYLSSELTSRKGCRVFEVQPEIPF